MRRARIKAIATVPVRRKANQDNAAAESSSQADAKVPERPSENSESNVESTSAPVKDERTEDTSALAIPKKDLMENKKENECLISNKQLTVSPAKEQDCLKPKEKPTTSPDKEEKDSGPREKSADSTVKEKRLNQNASIILNESEQKNNVQQTSKVEILQKSPVHSTEGSPVKAMQNRSCFMRPTPRLDGGGRIRRNSIQGSGASASESEDDSKRSYIPNRVRNDSVCSVQSLKDNSNTRLNLGQKRRMVVSESARKLAEARREFVLKHENKSPDKSKLTMYDLIYYNPTSNPMKPKPTTKPAARKISVCSVPDKSKDEEEAVDEPTEILVPQVKVGPNGQLVIDEQSLVIDQYKAQENIDRSDIIVDEDTTGNGFYKRRQKSKDWNKWETMKFYKALNTYGTDFLLMQSIFPKRTRQELKLKYKKEEKFNRNLVEKALLYQEFDTEALEKDLASVEESERKELESRKSRKGIKEKNPSTKRRRKRCIVVAEEVNCENDAENLEVDKDNCDEQSSDENARITITKQVRKRRTRKHKEPKLDADNCNKSRNDNSDSESEVYKAEPTRCGRVPRKSKKLQKPVKVFDSPNSKQAEQADEGNIVETNNREENHKEITINDTQNSTNTEIFNNKEININNTQNSDNIEIFDDTEISVNNSQNSNNIEIFDDSEVTVNNSQNSDNMEILNDIVNSEIIIEGVNNVNSIDQISDTPNNEEVEDQNKLLEILGVNSNVSSNTFDEIMDGIPNMTNLKPGSLVVLKKDSVDEPGKTILQVYIVSADYDANNPNCKDSLLPIDLSPDVLETVTNCIKDIQPQTISQECNVP